MQEMNSVCKLSFPDVAHEVHQKDYCFVHELIDTIKCANDYHDYVMSLHKSSIYTSKDAYTGMKTFGVVPC